jgi:hypothetical protein
MTIPKLLKKQITCGRHRACRRDLQGQGTAPRDGSC